MLLIPRCNVKQGHTARKTMMFRCVTVAGYLYQILFYRYMNLRSPDQHNAQSLWVPGSQLAGIVPWWRLLALSGALQGMLAPHMAAGATGFSVLLTCT